MKFQVLSIFAELYNHNCDLMLGYFSITAEESSFHLHSLSISLMTPVLDNCQSVFCLYMSLLWKFLVSRIINDVVLGLVSFTRLIILVPSLLYNASLLHAFSLVNSILLYRYTHYFFFHWLMDI